MQKKYYIAHYDFWFTKNKARAVLETLAPVFQKTFKDKKPNNELFLFALEKGNILVGTILVIFDALPTNKILNTIVTEAHNVLVDKADVYEEGEIIIIESTHNLLPFQFMMGELILGDYSH